MLAPSPGRAPPFGAARTALALSVALVLSCCGTSCARQLHRRQGSVLVIGDGWGEIGPCG